MGIIAVALSINPHLAKFDWFNVSSFLLSSNKAKVLEVGEFPVNILNISQIPNITKGMSEGKNSKQPDMQNASFLAPQAEGEWAKKNDMPMGKYCSVCEVNGKIYAIGGSNWNGVFSTVEEYDPVKDAWIKKADMPTARYCLSVCVLNGKIYAMGGANNGPRSELEEYDPIKWSLVICSIHIIQGDSLCGRQIRLSTI